MHKFTFTGKRSESVGSKRVSITSQQEETISPDTGNILKVQGMSKTKIELAKNKPETINRDDLVELQDMSSEEIKLSGFLKPEIVNIDDTIEEQGLSSVENELLKAIIDMLEIIPKLSAKTKVQRKENAEFSVRLIKKFKQLQGRYMSVNDKKNILNEYINAELDNIAKKRSYTMESKSGKILATNFLNKMLEFLDLGEDNSSKDDRSDRSDEKSTADFLKSLRRKHDELKARKVTDEKIKMALLAETRKKLDSILKHRDETLDVKVKNHLAEVLLITLLKSEHKQKKNATPKTLDDLVKMLAEYSIHSAEHIKRKVIRNMNNNIRALEENNKYKGTELKDQLKIHAMHEINNLLEYYLETLTPAVKEKIIINLVDEICDSYKKKEKKERAEELDYLVDDLHGSLESLNINKQERSVNGQVAAWFKSVQYKPSAAREKRIVERLSQNLKRIKNKDLDPGQLRIQIARELRYFSEEVAEVTGERVNLTQKDKLIQKLLTDSNIDIPKEMNAGSSSIPVSSKDQKSFSRKLSIHSNCNSKSPNHNKKKLSIDDNEETPRYIRRQKSKSKDTDSTEISEYDYNGRRIRRLKVEPKYVVTGNKTKSDRQKKRFGPKISTEKIKQTTLKTKKCTSASKGNGQDPVNKTLDEIECESIISEEEIAKLFDDYIHYEILKQVKRASKQKEVWDDVYISSPSEEEFLQYNSGPSETDHKSKQVPQQNVNKKNVNVSIDNKLKEAKKYTTFSTTETSDIEELRENEDRVGIRKLSLTSKEIPNDRSQQISTICNKKHNRAYTRRSPDILEPQAILSDELPDRRIFKRSSIRSPIEDMSGSPEGHEFEGRKE